jgi:hypothetical protein
MEVSDLLNRTVLSRTKFTTHKVSLPACSSASAHELSLLDIMGSINR